MNVRERYSMLRDFHRRIGEPANDVPTEPGVGHAMMRVRIIWEEMLKLAEALGVRIELITNAGKRIDMYGERMVDVDSWKAGKTAMSFAGGKAVNFTEAVDAMRDLEYAIHGTDLVLGTSDAAEDTFEAVHCSNMGKTAGGSLGAKAIKPKSWKPPRLGRVLRRVFPGQRLMFEE